MVHFSFNINGYGIDVFGAHAFLCTQEHDDTKKVTTTKLGIRIIRKDKVHKEWIKYWNPIRCTTIKCNNPNVITHNLASLSEITKGVIKYERREGNPVIIKIWHKMTSEKTSEFENVIYTMKYNKQGNDDEDEDATTDLKLIYGHYGTHTRITGDLIW